MRLHLHLSTGAVAIVETDRSFSQIEHELVTLDWLHFEDQALSVRTSSIVAVVIPSLHSEDAAEQSPQTGERLDFPTLRSDAVQIPIGDRSQL